MSYARKPVYLLLVLFAFPVICRAQQCCVNVAFGNVNTSTTSYQTASFGEDFGTVQYLVSESAPTGFQVVYAPTELTIGSSLSIEVSFTPSNMGSYSGEVIVYYAPYAGGPPEYEYQVWVSGAGVVPGFLNPKYLIVGVQYAPPGTSSSVTYGSNSVVGTSTSYAASFSSQTSTSISLSGGIKIRGFTVSATNTVSSSYTQENDTSTSVAVSQTTSYSTGLRGQTVALDHDWDYIFVWLNPIATFTVGPSSHDVTWTGYGYDLNDSAAYPDMEVIGIPLGCLNGDFGWSSSQCVNISPRLARSWALNNTDGTGPGLTSTDLVNVEKADPFYTTYTLTFPPGSSTTTDGRFTACSNTGCSATIDYEQGVNINYSQGYSTTVTQSQTAKNTYSTTFSVEDQVKGPASSFAADLKSANTLTWSEQFSQSTNNSNGQIASFAITGPSSGSGYTGPAEFVAYQDNLYGTFMFYPVQ